MNILNKESPDLYSSGDLFVQRVGDGPEGQDAMASAYLRMKAEGLLPWYYYENQPSLADFMATVLNPKALTMICISRLLSDVCGFGVVSQPHSIAEGKYEKAECSMVFFRKRQKPDLTIPFAHIMIEMAFDRNEKLAVMCGCTPEKNRAALRYIAAVGFKKSTEPVENYASWRGELCGCFTSWMTRERWGQVRPAW